MEIEKKRWNKPKYNARKTDGILSYLPITRGLPYRITKGGGKHFKDFGVHNGTFCTLEGMSLSVAEEAKVKENKDAQIVLLEMPTALIVILHRDPDSIWYITAKLFSNRANHE